MNLIAVSNHLKELSDGQLVQQMQNPSPAAPSYLVLSELQRRKEMRSGQAQPAPGGTMAEQYTQGLGANGPQNIVGAMGQSQATGQPVPYAGGQMQAMPPQNQMMERPMPGAQGFAGGGSVAAEKRFQDWANRYNPPGPVDPPAPTQDQNAPSPMLQRFRGAMAQPQTDMFTKMIGDSAPSSLTDAENQERDAYQFNRTDTERFHANRNLVDQRPAAGPPLPPDNSIGDPMGSGVPNAPATSLGLPQIFPQMRPVYQKPDPPTGLWGLSQPPGVYQGNGPVSEDAPAEDTPDPQGNGPIGGGPPTFTSDDMPPARRGLSARGAGGGGGMEAAAARGPQGIADFIGDIRKQMGPDRYEALSKDNADAKEKLKAAKETDKGLALLQAGLGILGGTSPNAGVNIGRGASMGLQAYNEANKETRVAEQGLRTADQQIAIAQANRDERMLETAVRTKMHYEEQMQRSLDRQSAAGIAAGSRADALAMKEADLKDRALDRRELREQHRIGSLQLDYKNLTSQADALDMKLLTLKSDPLDTPEMKQAKEAQAAQVKSQADALRTQANQSAEMYRGAVIEREVNSGRIKKFNSPEEVKAAKLKSGTRFVDPEGNIRIVP